MKTTSGSARTWTFATVVIAALLVVAAWFLLISPVLAQASETRAVTEEQEAANDIARQEVNELRAEFARMDEYQAQLDALQVQIPLTQRYADLQRLIAQVAEDNDVVVARLEFGMAEEVEPPPAPPAPEPVEGADPAAEPPAPAPGEEGATDPAAAAPVDPTAKNLFKISVSIEFEGRYADVLAAINQLQTGEQRILLLTGVALSADDTVAEGVDEAEETPSVEGADAAIAELEGQTFVLADPDDLEANLAPEPQLEPSEAPEPLPESSANPLSPADE